LNITSYRNQSTHSSSNFKVCTTSFFNSPQGVPQNTPTTTVRRRCLSERTLRSTGLPTNQQPCFMNDEVKTTACCKRSVISIKIRCSSAPRGIFYKRYLRRNSRCCCVLTGQLRRSKNPNGHCR
jgi:hypothetical protein